MSKRKFFLIISVILLILFTYFSYLVAKETYNQFDFDTTVKVQDHLSRKVDLPFSFLSFIGMAEISGLIWLSLVIYTLIRRFWLTALALLSFVVATMVEVFGKIVVYHPGPPFLFFRGVLDFNFPTHYVHTSYSYPSGHVTRAAFLVSFLMVWLILRVTTPVKWLVQLILLSYLILMIVSRIYLGEHWTTDVIGGLLLGSSLGIFSAITLPAPKRQQIITETIGS